MKTSIFLSFALVWAIAGSTSSLTAQQKAPELKPLLAVPDKVVYENDFSKDQPLDKKEWMPRQGTQWKIKDGVLRGQPSTPEYQASRPDHKGLEARIAAPITPSQFIARFSIRFIDGSENAVVPFVEFGHHVVRLKFGSNGLSLLADHETLKLGEAKDWKYKPGEWYHVLAELKGEEFVVQFAGGPTLYARHASLAAETKSGSSGLGIAGTKNGAVEIDNVTLWSITSQTQPNWNGTRAKLAIFPVEKLKEKKSR